jgi:dipeptidase E
MIKQWLGKNEMKKLKAFLFSDHRAPASLPLDAQALAATGVLDPTVAWIPSGGSPEKTDAFFAERRRYYSAIGVDKIEMFCLHHDFEKRRISDILRKDIVHLSGGDPFVFLRNLRATGVLEALRERARGGGVTVGDSGGAMLMSRDIEMCRFGHIPVPHDLTSLSSLGLVDFDFHPHFGRYGASLEQLKAHSKNKGRVVYAVQDGGGLAAVGTEILPYGSFVHIIDGKEMNGKRD